MSGTHSRSAHVTALLRESAAYRDPNQGRRHITGQLHALRVGGILHALHGDEAGLVGLVHDLARPLNDVHHGEVIAEIVRDRVSEAAYLTLRHHGEFQSAVIHGTPPPSADALDIALCDAELLSFHQPYDAPTYELNDAIRVIERWLG